MFTFALGAFVGIAAGTYWHQPFKNMYVRALAKWRSTNKG